MAKKKTEQSNRSNIVTNLIETLKIVHTQKIYLKIKQKKIIISFSSKNKMNLNRGGRKRRKKEKREK